MAWIPRVPSLLRLPAVSRLGFVPRLLPMVIVTSLALVGMKSVGLVQHALASGGAAAPATPAPAPPKRQPPPGAATAPAPPPVQQPEVIAPAAPLAPSEPPVSAAERSILLDLRKRRAELEGREAALATREGMLAATEKRLTDRATELADLQRRLEALETARRDRDEESWRGLVKLYETMKPREAAAIFNDLDRPVLLAVLDRMKEAKAAPVLAAMQPERARQITAELAQRRTQANRPADPVPPRPSGG
jgi:flagellar motility protein MotE (MotC chaperone)